MRANVITRHGGPEVLELRDEPEPEPGDGELLVALEAAGINFRDVYERAGRGYAGNSQPPLIGGVEGAGTVLRSNSPEFSEGDRVGWRRRTATPSAWWCPPRPPCRSRTAARTTWPPPRSCRA